MWSGDGRASQKRQPSKPWLPHQRLTWHSHTLLLGSGKHRRRRTMFVLKHNIDIEQTGINWSFINLDWQHQLELVVQWDSCQAYYKRRSQNSWLEKSNLVFLSFTIQTDTVLIYNISKTFASSSSEIMQCRSISQKTPLFDFKMGETDKGNIWPQSSLGFLMLNTVSSLRHVICRMKSEGCITHKLFHVWDKPLKIKICLSFENTFLPTASNLTHQIRIQVPKQPLDLCSE